VGEDRSERRLAEARRAVEEHVIERLAALPSRLQEDAKLFLDPGLPDELVQLEWTKPGLLLEILAEPHRVCDTTRMLHGSGGFRGWSHGSSLTHTGRGFRKTRQRLAHERLEREIILRSRHLSHRVLRLGRTVTQTHQRRDGIVEALDLGSTPARWKGQRIGR
jgi:hypothetical protein